MATKNEAVETQAVATDTPVVDIAGMIAQAKAWQEQQAAFAAQSAAVREALQVQIKALDDRKAALDGPYREEVAAYQALIKDAETAYQSAVKDILVERQELAGQLQLLIAAGAGKPTVAATKTTTPAATGTATRNSGVKELVFGLLDADPSLTGSQLAERCAAHYGNDSTTANSCNGLKVAWNKLNGK